MFQQQEYIIKQQSAINTWLNQYAPEKKVEFAKLISRSQDFQVRVPLVGAFSSGKSSLLNTMLGEKLLAVEINPETALPAELFYAPQEKIIFHENNGIRNLSRSDLLNGTLDNANPNSWVEIALNHPSLAKIPYLRIVDMPGLNSGHEHHNLAIDHYIGRSLAYCMVVSIEDGNINQSTLDFLKELALHDKPIILVANKSDSRPDEDAQQVFNLIQENIRQVFPQPPLKAILTSRKESQAPQFVEALMALDGQAEAIFKKEIGQPVIYLLTLVAEQLGILSNQENYNIEEIQEKKKKIEADFQRFTQKMEKETDELQKLIEPTAQKIVRSIISRLTSQLDSLVSDTINGQKTDGRINTTIRQALTEGIQREFLPKVERYKTRISSEFPQDITININTDIELENTNNKDFGFMNIITLALTALLGKSANPLLMVIVPVINVLSIFNQSEKEEQERQQRADIRKQFEIDIFPEVESQTNPLLLSTLSKNIDAIQELIQQKATERQREIQVTLTQLEKELQQGKQEFEQKQAVYLRDQQAISQLIQQLKEI